MFSKKLTALTIAIITTASVAYAAPDAALSADDQAINAACASDAATAGCGNDKVGTGLLKCLHAYKKSNPAYKFSANCKAAAQKRRADKKAGM